MRSRRLKRAFYLTRKVNSEPNSTEAIAIRTRYRMEDRALIQRDKGLELIELSEKTARRHSIGLTDLVMRTVGLFGAIGVTNDHFADADLPEIKLDHRAAATIKRHAERLMDISLFIRAAKEMIDDKRLRREMIDLHVRQVLAPTIVAGKKDDQDNTDLKQLLAAFIRQGGA